MGDEKEKIVREYLTKRGFFLNDGIKYGLDLLVYTDNPDKIHSKYGLVVYNNMNFQQLVAYQRICNSNNKILLVAVVKNKDEIEFFEFKRIGSLINGEKIEKNVGDLAFEAQRLKKRRIE